MISIHRAAILLALLAVSNTAGAQQPSISEASQEVTFTSGDVSLRGTLYAPEGPGPFPAVVYNHGSAPGNLNDLAFQRLGPMFVERGWIFFAPYRRGQGLSAAAGPYVVDTVAGQAKRNIRRSLLPVIVVTLVTVAALLCAMRRRRWAGASSAAAVIVTAALVCLTMARDARGSAIIHVLQEHQLGDHLAAYRWLAQQSTVDPARIATAGNSFGGIISLLAAKQVHYCAVIDAAGGAENWSAPVGAAMTDAVRQSRSPMFFFQAENDYNIEPTRALGRTARSAGRRYEARIYPAFGTTASDGHSFAWRGSDIWADDVMRFLEANCGPK